MAAIATIATAGSNAMPMTAIGTPHPTSASEKAGPSRSRRQADRGHCAGEAAEAHRGVQGPDAALTEAEQFDRCDHDEDGQQSPNEGLGREADQHEARTRKAAAARMPAEISVRTVATVGASRCRPTVGTWSRAIAMRPTT